MKLIVVGASGQCGQWLVRAAVARGYDVTAYVRPSTVYPAPDGVRVVRGEVTEPSTVGEAMMGHDAVLSCVGPQRVNPANPFSPLKSPPHFCEQSARVLVTAAQQAGIGRLGAISAAGVAESAALLPWMMTWLLRHSTIGVMYADLCEMEQVYASSTLDWFAVRPVTLVNAPPTTRAREVSRFRMVSTIGRADVAQYMIDMLGPNPPSRSRTPFIGWK